MKRPGLIAQVSVHKMIPSLFSPEHRTPPLPLVALIGNPEYHKDAADYFVQQLRPPLVSLSSTEPVEQFVPRAFGESSQTCMRAWLALEHMPTSSNVAGTLKTSPPSVATSTPGIMKVGIGVVLPDRCSHVADEFAFAAG